MKDFTPASIDIQSDNDAVVSRNFYGISSAISDMKMAINKAARLAQGFMVEGISWIKPTGKNLGDFSSVKDMLEGASPHLVNAYYTSQWPSLTALLAAIGSNDATVYVNSTVTLTANATIPANVSVIPQKPGLFTGAYTLTINGSLTPVLFRIFYGGIILAGNPKVTELYPEMWGAVNLGAANDVTYIQAMLDFIEDNYSLGDGGVPDCILTNNYLCNSGLLVPTRVNLVGNRAHAAGNLNRNAARLIFTGLGINTKAITVGEDVVIRNLVISGPGASVSGTYGIYGGVAVAEGFGVNTQIIDCTIEDFETPVQLSRWVNLIDNCCIDDGIYGISLTGQANYTIIKNNRLNPGNASPRVAVLINGAIEGVYIHDNNIEDLYYGIVVIRGQGVVIHHNRFEIVNKCAINVRGDGSANDAGVYVDMHHNYILDYGASASSSGRFGFLIEAGHTTIDDNTIKRYDSGTNVGLQYGINFGGTGIIAECLIGVNHIECYQALAHINTFSEKGKVRSRFPRTINVMWDLGDDPGNNLEHYFQVSLPVGCNAVHSFRQFRLYNVDTLDAVPTLFSIGYVEATPSRFAYLTNFAPSAVTQYLVTYATSWVAAGLTFLSLSDARLYLIRLEPGSAVSGRIVSTLIIDEFQY